MSHGCGALALIGSSPESCFAHHTYSPRLGLRPAETRPSRGPVSADSGAAGAAKQPHLSRRALLRGEAAQPKQGSADN